MRRFLGITCAVLAHAAVLLFGGLVFGGRDQHGPTREVELLSAMDEPKKEEPPPPEPETVPETEPPPDASEILKNLEQASNDAPALDAVSLGALEQALNGAGGGVDFGSALSFESGGRLGGTGKGGLADQLDKAFSLSEIDQQPRVVFQAAPLFPAEMRSKKVEGVVSLLFVVDAGGKVSNPRVEKASHPAFEKPALAAIKQWKFEPAVRAGKRVDCRMRQQIRFQPN